MTRSSLHCCLRRHGISRLPETSGDKPLRSKFHYERHDQIRQHTANFVVAYNFARRLKTLRDLTPYEVICKAWTDESARFILNPRHQIPGLKI